MDYKRLLDKGGAVNDGQFYCHLSIVLMKEIFQKHKFALYHSIIILFSFMMQMQIQIVLIFE